MLYLVALIFPAGALFGAGKPGQGFFAIILQLTGPRLAACHHLGVHGRDASISAFCRRSALRWFQRLATEQQTAALLAAQQAAAATATPPTPPTAPGPTTI